MTKGQIFRSFKREIKNTFSEDLLFGFLCGSFVRNKVHKNSDIDIFICVKKRNEEKEILFKDWYMSLHKKVKLKPDLQFYYEIMEPKDLLVSLTEAELTIPHVRITRKVLYDGIVWAGMLSGKYTSFIGSRSIYIKFRRKAKKVVTLWRDAIIQDIAKLPSDQFLKLTTEYVNFKD